MALRWASEKQYERVLAARAAEGATSFVLHDGPAPTRRAASTTAPCSTRSSRILVRALAAAHGEARRVRPGWDCHACPSSSRSKKSSARTPRRSTRPPFGASARSTRSSSSTSCAASSSVSGASATGTNPYLTLSKDYEATIVRQLAAFARRGLVYRDKKPVHWCLVHKTALAEAEVEYEDHSSPSIYVRMPLVESPGKAVPALEGRRVAFVIWTTTPWTLPANLAIVANPELDYVAIPHNGEFLIVAAGRAEAFHGGDRYRRSARDVGRDFPGGAARARGRALRSALPRRRRKRRDLPPVLRAPRDARGGHGLGSHGARPRPADDYIVGASTSCRSTRPSTPRESSTRRWARARRSTSVRTSSRRTRSSSRSWRREVCCSTRPARRSATRTLLLALQEPHHLPRDRAVVRAPRRGR